jgi:hypothetical protein
MKNSIKNLEAKTIKNTKSIKGGAFGKGTRNTASTTSARPELL